MDERHLIYSVIADDFEKKVIEASHSAVVVVDFWAEWCGPCKMLSPVLEKVVLSYNGRAVLAKVNVDENQELAMYYNIQSIPAVKIFKDGELVDEFIGVIPEHEITRILAQFAGSKSDDMLKQADGLLRKGKKNEAAALYRSILETDRVNAGALIGLALIAIKNGEIEQSRELLGAVEETDRRYPEAAELLAHLRFSEVCAGSGGWERNKKAADVNPDDLEARYNLGCCYAASSMYHEALDEFLSIIAKNSSYADGKAKDGMLSIFSLLGQNDPLVGEYRKKLANILF